MSKAAREALWAKERAERTANPSAPQARRPQKPSRGRWAVIRINDDGRREVAKSGLTYEQAAAEAGRRRDRMPDAEVGEGWNYLPHNIAVGGKAMRPSTPARDPGQQGERGFSAHARAADHPWNASGSLAVQRNPGVRHSR